MSSLWGDCELVYSHESRQFSSTHYKNLTKYIDSYRDAINCNIWFDHENKQYFSAAQTIATPQSGKHHSFIMSRAPFFTGDFSGANNLINMGNSYLYLKNSFPQGPIVSTPEFRCGFDNCVQEIHNQDSVFIVGGGPSTLTVNFDEYKQIPKWTMNNFYKNEHFRDMDNIQLVSFLDGVDLNDTKLYNFLTETKPIVMQEFSDPGYKDSRIKLLLSKYDRISYFMTRYRSRIGIGARLVVLAILMGTKDIYISGLDGYNISESNNHVFEDNKAIPNWLASSGPALQKQQFVIYWDYILNELKKSYDFNIYDLSKGQETVQYAFLQEHIF